MTKAKDGNYRNYIYNRNLFITREFSLCPKKKKKQP